MLTEPKPETTVPGKSNPEKVRGMNASLTTEAATAGGLRERNPERLHITRRQVAFAVILAVLAVVATVLTVDSISSSTATYAATVTTSKTYQLNFSGTGTITSIQVKVGDVVHQGQVLAVEDTTALQSQVDAAKGVVVADQAALAQAQAPQVTPAQRQQDQLQLSQAQTALSDAQAALATAQSTGKAQVAAAQAAAASLQALAASDGARYQQACPNGPVPPPAGLTGATAQAAEETYSHCQDLQLQYDKDTAAVAQAQAAVPTAEAQAQASVNAAQSTVNSAQAAENLAQYQETLQSSETNPAAVAQAQANLAQAQGQLQAAEDALAAATIVAPDSCTVAAVYGQVGELAGPDGVHQYSAPALPQSSSNNASFQLFPSPNTPASPNGPALEPVVECVGGVQQVTAQVPESAVGSLPAGHTVTVSVPDLHATVTGTVSAVNLNPAINGSQATYRVDVDLSRTIPGLLPGMSATVSG